MPHDVSADCGPGRGERCVSLNPCDVRLKLAVGAGYRIHAVGSDRARSEADRETGGNDAGRPSARRATVGLVGDTVKKRTTRPGETQLENAPVGLGEGRGTPIGSDAGGWFEDPMALHEGQPRRSPNSSRERALAHSGCAISPSTDRHPSPHTPIVRGKGARYADCETHRHAAFISRAGG